jgi:hypothetical protein
MSIFNRTTSASAKVSRLTDTEQAELAKCESIISAHVASYAKVGACLASIREKQLYRDRYESFEAYVTEKWQMTADHARRLMAAAGVHANLEPMGSTPANERQARPLTALDAGQQLDAWEDAQLLAGDEPLTVAHVEEAVSKRKKTRKPKLAKQVSLKVPGARVVVIPNKAFRGYDQALSDALAKYSTRDAA